MLVTGELLVEGLALPGDYNSNGIVDAADYAIWRNNFGLNVTLPNENPLAKTLASSTYFWKSRFGNSFGSGSGNLNGPSVPEPATLALLAIAVTAGCHRVRCRKT